MRRHGEPVDLLTPKQVRERTPAVKQEGLQLALGSHQEVCVDPREVVAGLPVWLSRRFGVDFRVWPHDHRRFDCRLWPPAMRDGRPAGSGFAPGDELELLFADEFAACGLVRCKLQMMRSAAYGTQLADRPDACRRADPTPLRLVSKLPEPASAYAVGSLEEAPWLDRLGIHVLVSQNGRGELTIGDSHEYGDADRSL